MPVYTKYFHQIQIQFQCQQSDWIGGDSNYYMGSGQHSWSIEGLF